jgi:hypothetical protein
MDDKIKRQVLVLSYLQTQYKPNIFGLQRDLNINNPAEYIRQLRKKGHNILTKKDGKYSFYEVVK